ncbi:MAG: hypothetical protein ACOCP7_01010 [Desulfohalobiaceae bacterium]
MFDKGLALVLSSLLCAAFWLLCNPGQAIAESDMLRVQPEMDISQQDSDQERDLYPELRNLGFAQALLRKTEDFLPGSLAKDRKEALLDFLVPRAEDFVLSYSEQGTHMQGNMLGMSMAVKINTWALKEFLQTWGTYYTADVNWEYSLNLKGDWQEQDLMLLQTLQKISGLDRTNSVLPKLELKRTKNGEPWWQGRLQTQDQEWTRTADNLQEVWRKLWGRFFRQKEVQSLVIQEYVLQAWGWSGVNGIWEFDRNLSAWDLVAKRPRIIQLDLSRGQLQASWEVQTGQQEELLKILQQEMSPRGLEFALRRAEEYRAEVIPAAAE